MNNRPVLFIALGAVALVAAVLAYVFLIQAPATTKAGADTANLPKPSTSASDVVLDTDLVLGAADAPITVFEYASLTCSHCSRFHVQVLPQIKQYFIDTGKVRWVFRDYPLDPVAMAASVVVTCLPKEQRVAFMDVLFRNQQTWAFVENPREGLIEISRRANLTRDQVEACLKNDAEIKRINESARAAQSRYKITGTPTFVVNGQVLSGERSFQEMDALFKSLAP